MTTAFPLQWPAGMRRTAFPDRSAFGAKTIRSAYDFAAAEIRRMGGSAIVVSSNLRLRGDGTPYSDQRQPADVGVAVYFQRRGQSVAFACDRWQKLEHNLYAIGKTIEALRGIERWGSADTVDQAFAGFVALPPPLAWWTVLGVDPESGVDVIEAHFRTKAKTAHPDAGGSHAAMSELTAARDAGLKARGAK
jgi:hypothetical protein